MAAPPRGEPMTDGKPVLDWNGNLIGRTRFVRVDPCEGGLSYQFEVVPVADDTADTPHVVTAEPES